jgi:hypothetical protein
MTEDTVMNIFFNFDTFTVTPLLHTFSDQNYGLLQTNLVKKGFNRNSMKLLDCVEKHRREEKLRTKRE